jgi:hypothetical protein
MEIIRHQRYRGAWHVCLGAALLELQGDGTTALELEHRAQGAVDRQGVERALRPLMGRTLALDRALLRRACQSL